jgi:hypothetical protein
MGNWRVDAEGNKRGPRVTRHIKRDRRNRGGVRVYICGWFGYILLLPGLRRV